MIVIADIGESGKLDVREIVNSLSINKLSAKWQIFLSIEFIVYLVRNVSGNWFARRGGGDISRPLHYWIVPPPTPQLTSHPPPLDALRRSGEELAIAEVTGYVPPTSHTTPARLLRYVRSVSLLTSVAPLAPLRHHSLRVFAPRVLEFSLYVKTCNRY